MVVFRAIAGICVFFALGSFFLRAICGKRSVFGAWASIAVSFGLGAGFAAWFCILLLHLGIPFQFSSILLLGLIPGYYEVKRCLHSPITPSFGSYEAVILLAFAAVAFLSFSFPLRFWDSRAFWGLTAKIISTEKIIYNQYMLNPELAHPHFHYPLLVPALYAWLYEIMGRINDHALMLFVPLFYFMLILFFSGAGKTL